MLQQGYFRIEVKLYQRRDWRRTGDASLWLGLLFFLTLKGRLMRKLVIVSVATVLLGFGSESAYPAIISQNENFNDGKFADDAALVAAGYTFDSPDPLQAQPGNNAAGAGGLDILQTKSDTDAGDGVNDGAIFVDGTPLGESVTFPFAGTIATGETYIFDANLFRSSTSFTVADVELLADSSVVASLTAGGINGSVEDDKPETPVQLMYTGTAGTDGQTLSFRITQARINNGSVDVGIDNWTLTVIPVPEPGASFLLGLGLFALAVGRRHFV